MENEYLEVKQDVFDDIVEEIKQKNLSRNNMPKLIIGTGLSVMYGVPGMKELSDYLHNHINQLPEKDLKDMWNKHYPNIKTSGLEAGLLNLTPEESVLVDVIKPLTAKFILESEEKLHDEILKRDTGFGKLLNYLSSTVSVSRRLIDIMTPNYDRIIELVCDKNGLGVITGFSGNIYGKFNKNLLKQPADTYNLKILLGLEYLSRMVRSIGLMRMDKLI